MKTRPTFYADINSYLSNMNVYIFRMETIQRD